MSYLNLQIENVLFNLEVHETSISKYIKEAKYSNNQTIKSQNTLHQKSKSV